MAEPGFPEDKIFLDAYFDYILEPAREGHASKIVFFDFGISGKSLSTLKHFVSDFCARKSCGPAQLGFLTLSFDRKLRQGKDLDGVTHVSWEIDDLLRKHHFDYLRKTERQTALQWLAWMKENKITSEQGMCESIARRLKEMALTEGIARYQDAVDIFQIFAARRVFFRENFAPVRGNPKT